MNPAQEKPVHMGQMLEVCDREGNSQNGGGSFAHYQDHSGIHLIRFEPGRNLSMSGRIGDIGSPIVGGAMPAIGAQRPFQQPGGF